MLNDTGILINIATDLYVKYMDYEDIQDYGQTKEIVTIHGYDWTVKDMFGDDDHVAIHCWGLDRDSVPYLLRFTNFPSFCYVELPMFVRNRIYNWTSKDADNFYRMLSMLLGEHTPYDHKFVYTKKLYYYRAERMFPMLRLSFTTISSMWKCVNLLENPLKTDDWGFIKCNVWENNISIIRKLLTVRNIKYSQWFTVQATKVDPELQISTLKNEFIAEWDTIVAVPLEECKSWNTQPMVLAFDIECYSNNYRAMPDKYNALHVAYMISCISQRYRNTSTRRRFGVIIGDCNHIPPERLANCEIIKVETEYEMIQAFGKIILEIDPEIITGYNILGFDYPYLDYRIKRRLKPWPCMGRIIGEPSYMTSKTWKSGAYGHQSINILQMEGRISIDPLPIVKRDYKLDKYDLNTVSKKFIGKTKHDIKPVDMFISFERMRDAIKAHLMILEQEKHNPDIANDPEFIVHKQQVLDSLNIERDETTKVMEYCIQDSELVIDLIEKLNIWVGLIEMSNIVGTTIVDLFTRGQQVRCVSQLYDLAARTGFVLDSRDTPGFKFCGGFVHEPIPGLYDNVLCFDFASLYPSIMMAFNICYTTLVMPELQDYVPDEDCHVIEFDQEEEVGSNYVRPEELDRDLVNEDIPDFSESNKDILEEKITKNKKGKPVITKHYKFKFYKHVEGLLPRLVRLLVTERRAVIKNSGEIKEAVKILERTENIRIALNEYLSNNVIIEDPDELKKHIKELCDSTPPAAPEVITAAKKRLIVAELFNVKVTQKNLLEAKDINEDLSSLLKLEAQIAQLYEEKNINRLKIILDDLTASKDSRMKEIDSTKILITTLDKRQLGLKVSANSFFGFLGVHSGGMMPLIEGAMSITAKGRELIGQVRSHLETKYGGTQVYSDTDTCRGHTPVLIRYSTGAINFVQLKDIIPLNPNPPDHKDWYDLSKYNMDVWTEQGWTRIKRLMRHRTPKQLYRVVTHTGIVDVTEDHSLLNENAEEVTPNQVNIGMRLLHKDLPNPEWRDNNMDEEKAWLWGFFMAEGTCGIYDCPSGLRKSWSISNQNLDFLDKAQRIANRTEPDCTFVIDPCMKSSNVDKLNSRGSSIALNRLITKYNNLFYTERSTTMKQNKATNNGIRFKKVPYEILMATNNIKQAFFQGWYDGDGAKTTGNTKFSIKGQIGAAGLFLISTAIGYKVSVDTRTDKEEIYNLTLTMGKQRKHPNVIKKIIPLGAMPDEDVFDIETENHHFAAGIGRMVVHNSSMVVLPCIKNPKECNYWGNKLAQDINGIKPGDKDVDGVIWTTGRPGLFPPPLAVEFEKAMRLLCIKKKKYVALLIAKDGTFKTEDITDKHGNVIGRRPMMLKKGIPLARRDNCNFLRTVYTTILDLIMSRSRLDQAINVLVKSIQDLLCNKVSYEDLVIIRGLGANYKSENYFMKLFGDNLRKAGKIVSPGDRLDFVIVEDPNVTLLGHKMRLVEQYLEGSEKIDIKYYIENILMNSVNQLFEVGFKDMIRRLPHVYYHPPGKRKQIQLDKPVNIILALLEKGYDISLFAKAIEYNVDKIINPPIPVLNILPYYVREESTPVVLNVISSPKINNSPRTLTLPNIGKRSPNKVQLNIIHK